MWTLPQYGQSIALEVLLQKPQRYGQSIAAGLHLTKYLEKFGINVYVRKVNADDEGNVTAHVVVPEGVHQDEFCARLGERFAGFLVAEPFTPPDSPPLTKKQLRALLNPKPLLKD